MNFNSDLKKKIDLLLSNLIKAKFKPKNKFLYLKNFIIKS